MKRVLIGNGGHAREVMAQMGTKLDRFVDDQYVDEHTLPISQLNPKNHIVMIAIADSVQRQKIVKRLPKGIQFFTFIHPTALIMSKDVEIGEGSFIGAYSILTTNIKIGKHAILNRGNQIGHDSVIGDFFSAMPGSIVSGNVIIEERVYMGTNSSIKEKINICSDVIIGSNATVVKNITTSGTYVGVPTKNVKK
jgi:sugar O-acyltransferase (sialic acid O-acetyltransferase NeuD family)